MTVSSLPAGLAEPGSRDRASSTNSDRFRQTRRLVTGFTVAGAVWFGWAKRADIPATWDALRGASAAWTTVAVGLAGLAMVNQMLLHRASQRSLGLRIPTRDVWGATNAAFFVNAVAKSGGLAGVVAFTSTSKRHRQPRSTTIAAYLVVTVLVQWGFALSLLAALIVLNTGGRVTTTEVVASLVFGMYTLGLAVAVGAAFHSRRTLRLVHALPVRVVRVVRRDRSAPPVDHQAADALFDSLQSLRRSPRLVVGTVGHAIGVQVIEVAMLWTTLRAVGADVGPAVAIVAYSVAVMFLIASILPGGVGLVEASLAVVLAGYGLPVGTIAAAVVVYRVIELWIPFTVGAIAAHRLRPDVHPDVVEAAEDNSPNTTGYTVGHRRPAHVVSG